MKDIKTYIEESLFSDKSDEQSVTQKVNGMLTIKNIPEDLEGILDYYCAWHKILFNTSMVRNTQKQYLNLALEVFLDNLPKYSLSLSEYNIETIKREELHIPMGGYVQSWDKLFELKPIRKEDIKKEIKKTMRQSDDVHRRYRGKYDFIPHLFFVNSDSDYNNLNSIIFGRYNCIVRPEKLHGDRSWKTMVRKRTKQYIDNIKNVLSNLGFQIQY